MAQAIIYGIDKSIYCSNLILDPSKGIDKTGGFKIFKKVTGTNTITKNEDGTYTVFSKGGSGSQGTDLAVTTSFNNAKVLIEFKINAYDYTISNYRWVDNKRISLCKFDKQVNHTLYCELEFIDNANASCIGVTSVGKNCEIIITRAWLLGDK